jgi:dihydroxyacetone kinase phosphoprotein-dependent L subunit
MARAINSAGLRQLLAAAADSLEREESRLTALDSAIGDGDHGITMRIGFQAVRKATQALPMESLPSQVFATAGQAFMNSTGGAIGVLLGRALRAAGEEIHGQVNIGSAQWKHCLQAMESAVASAGKAKHGDKTLLDPLHAVNEVCATVEDDAESSALLSVAAEAAERAAAATSAMRCRVGRASRLGDRALGHPDPGAVSFSIIMRAFADRARTLPPESYANLR